MIKSDYLKFLKKREVAGKPIVDKIGKLNTFLALLQNSFRSNIRVHSPLLTKSRLIFVPIAN